MFFDSNGDIKVGAVVKTVIGVIIFIIVLSLILGCFGTVSAGERGVKTRFGAIASVATPGLYFKLPIIERMTMMDVHTQSLISDLQAASNDLQDTRLSVVVNYHIEPTTVAEIYKQYGDAPIYYHTVVDPLITATIKAVASQYTASDQIQKRAEMSARALNELEKAFEGKNVVIEKADITNVKFSDSFTEAIEAKVTAIQNAEAAKNKLVQTQAEADQKVVTAKADAETIRIQAQAINSQGGADYVALQALKVWKGGCTSYCVGNDTQMPINFLNTLK